MLRAEYSSISLLFKRSRCGTKGQLRKLASFASHDEDSPKLAIQRHRKEILYSNYSFISFYISQSYVFGPSQFTYSLIARASTRKLHAQSLEDECAPLQLGFSLDSKTRRQQCFKQC